MRGMAGEPFWRRKTLEQMTAREWESLCDGCGLCCLVRFEDEETGEVIPTRVHCKLFDPIACRQIASAHRVFCRLGDISGGRDQILIVGGS